MTFPERIATIRKELKLSQEKFGELVGVSQRTVAFWEAGERTPSHSLTTSMADRLGCSVDYLLGRSDDKAQKKPAATEDDGLRSAVIDRVRNLPKPALLRLSDFLSGLEAAQEISERPPAAGGSGAGSAL